MIDLGDSLFSVLILLLCMFIVLYIVVGFFRFRASEHGLIASDCMKSIFILGEIRGRIIRFLITRMNVY